jgi:hypothetical protein
MTDIHSDNVLITVRTLNELLDAFTEQAGEFSPKWDSVKRYAIRLRYLESIDKAIKKWLERVEIST